MARDDEGREIDDTTVIAGGQQAWSDVEDQGEQGDRIDLPASHEAPVDRDGTDGTDGTGGRDGRGGRDGNDERDGRGGHDGRDGRDGERGGYDGNDDTGERSSGLRPNELGARDTEDIKVPDVPPGPALVAAGLGLLTKSGWVFKDINLTLRAASVAAIVGPAGTGRSCLLLSLSGRMETNTGTLTVAGHSMADKPAAVRAVTSVARISSITGPEPGLRVAEAIGQQCLLEDVTVLIGRSRFTEACAALQVEFNPSVLVGRLVGEETTLFAVALACVRVSAVILLDDLDRGVSAATQQRMLAALIRLSRTGPTIVLSTTDRIPVMDADVVLDLTPLDGAATWQISPITPPGTMLRQLGPGGLQRGPIRTELGPGPYPPPPDDAYYYDNDEGDQGTQAAAAPTEDSR